MPNNLDPSLRGLSDCDGCEGVSVETPVLVDNRAGLDEIAYRIGTHARFLESMHARLSSAAYAALRPLSTREQRDLTIAYLDACAAVDDGLTFYTERYANEWFVRTATERVSLVQLARLIGYEPRPGVAAGTYLLFTVADTPGTPESTRVDAGIKVMSIPGKDELPQTFESGAGIEARSVWNAMRVRTQAPQAIATDMTLVVLQGIEGGIRRGDSVLVVESATDTSVKRVRRITQDRVAGTTSLELADAPTPTSYSPIIVSLPYTYSTLPSLNDTNLGDVYTGQVFSSSDVTALNIMFGWASADFTYAANIQPPLPPTEAGVYALRQRAAVFGHNAPRWISLPQLVEGSDTQLTGRTLETRLSGISGAADRAAERAKWQYPDNWDDLSLEEENGSNANVVDLDNVYPAMSESSWVVLESPSVAARAYRVQQNQELTRNDYTLSVKVSRLTLDSNTNFDQYKMRETTVLGQSEKLPLAMVNIETVVAGNTVVLDRYYPGLVKGQLVALSGERTDLTGVPGTEVLTLDDVLIDGTLEEGRLFTSLKFATSLKYTYKPDTVRINANVVAATHGETKMEVLGSGDGATRYQTFTLKQSPLTYVSAQLATGVQSTLEVRVNNVLWKEVPTLYGRSPEEQVYVVRHEDDGKTKVQFNAPLPTGQENVTAKYRVGIGLPGLVKANQLSLLTVRPLGVQGVTNPLAPSGAEDKESIEDLRENSPLTILTLGRVVSLNDYESFARAFAGFSKALAVPTADGSRRGVFLTVAGETGEVSESSAEFGNLAAAIKAQGDPFVNVIVKPYRPAFFQVEGTVGVDPAYLPDEVQQAVVEALRKTFSFEARRFGQPVTQVEIFATIQNVPGVVYVTLTYLFRSDPLNPGLPKSLQNVLPAASPASGVSRFTAEAAELLILDPRPIQISTVSV